MGAIAVPPVMSLHSTRRNAVRAGAGVLFAVGLAGCGDDEPDGGSDSDTDSHSDRDETTGTGDDATAGGDDSDGMDADGPDIPGLQDGRITDARELGIAHEAVLGRRSGTLTQSATLLDRETGAVERAGMLSTAIDGDRIRARITGDHLYVGQEPERRELYAEDGTAWLATFVDGDVTVERQEPGSAVLRPPAVTGRNSIEGQLFGHELVGADPVEEGDDRYVFRDGGRGGGGDGDGNGDETEWYRAAAVVESTGLVHEWSQTIDADWGAGPQRDQSEWRVGGLLETTVEEPAWLEEAD